MKRCIVYAEGQTEEEFVNKVLRNHLFLNNNLSMAVKTFGGITSYAKIVRDIQRLCREDRSAYVTTMVDFYAFPPRVVNGKKIESTYKSDKDCYKAVEQVEFLLKEDVDERNFIPFIMLHEFESIVLINPNLLLDEIDEVNVDDLNAQIIRFSSPEEINHGKSTAPSKRIIKAVPQYKKIIHGINVAEALGIDEIRRKCPHFDKWICELTSIKTD